MALAEHYETAYSTLKTEGQVRKVLGDIHEELHGSKLKSSTARKFMKSWLSTKEVECSKNTYQKYRTVIDAFSGSNTTLIPIEYH